MFHVCGVPFPSIFFNFVKLSNKEHFTYGLFLFFAWIIYKLYFIFDLPKIPKSLYFSIKKGKEAVGCYFLFSSTYIVSLRIHFEL